MKEKIMTINFKSKLLKVNKWQRSKKILRILKDDLKKQTKADRVKIGDRLNKKIWERGAKNPISKIKVSVNISTTEKGKDKKKDEKEKIAKVELIESK